jgi:hypothetical protein
VVVTGAVVMGAVVTGAAVVTGSWVAVVVVAAPNGSLMPSVSSISQEVRSRAATNKRRQRMIKRRVIAVLLVCC